MRYFFSAGWRGGSVASAPSGLALSLRGFDCLRVFGFRGMGAVCRSFLFVSISFLNLSRSASGYACSAVFS